MTGVARDGATAPTAHGTRAGRSLSSEEAVRLGVDWDGRCYHQDDAQKAEQEAAPTLFI